MNDWADLNDEQMRLDGAKLALTTTADEVQAHRAELRVSQDELAWRWGDRLLAAFPPARRGARDRSYAAMQELVEREGLVRSAETLRGWRNIAQAWPDVRRCQPRASGEKGPRWRSTRPSRPTRSGHGSSGTA